MRDLHPKVFGLGLSRTGTASLGDALNILGIRTIHFPCDPQTFIELRTGNYDLTILKDYRGIVDIPVVPYYAQFDARFPGSKFILTVRDKDAWLASCERFLPVVRDLSQDSHDFADFVTFIHAAVYGVVPVQRERFAYVYDLHLRNVRAYFADRPDDLLVMDITAGDGWEKLCPFLGLDVPPTPFPHANVAGGLNGLADWLREVRRAAGEVQSAVPQDAAFLLLDDGLLTPSLAPGWAPLALPMAAGPVAECDGDLSVGELDAQRRAGADFVVLSKLGDDGVERYAALLQYLGSTYRRALDTDRVVIFDVRTRIGASNTVPIS